MLIQEKQTIDVERLLAAVVGSRDIADRLEDAIKAAHTKAVDLDFQKVEFVSRSAAHELLLIQESFRNKLMSKKEISFVNANKAVTEMFRVIASNRAMPKAPASFHPHRVSIQSLEV